MGGKGASGRGGRRDGRGMGGKGKARKLMECGQNRGKQMGGWERIGMTSRREMSGEDQTIAVKWSFADP